MARKKPRSYSMGNVPYLDVPILKMLPPQGALIGQYHPDALNVRTVAARLGGEVTIDVVNGRLRAMALMGQAVSVRLVPVSQGLGYQRSKLGDKYLEENG